MPPSPAAPRALLGEEFRQRSAELRFAALVAAVRDHEARGSRHFLTRRPHDLTLYRQLRRILGDALTESRA